MGWDTALGGLGAGLAQVGGMMSQWADEDEKRRARLELEREKILDRQQRSEDTNLTRMLIASQRGEGSKGGTAPYEEKDGNSLYESALLKLGDGDRSAGLAVFKALRTGDKSAFEENVETPTTTPGNAPGSIKMLTESADKLLKSKGKILSEIFDEMSYNKDYKEVTAGRRNQQGIKMTDQVLNGTVDAGEGAAAMNAGSDKPGPVYGGTKETSRNLFTGEDEINAIGNAEIGELNAKTRKENAAAQNLPKEQRDKRAESLRSEAKTLAEDNERLEKDRKDLRAAAKENSFLEKDPETILDKDKKRRAIEWQSRMNSLRERLKANGEASATIRQQQAALFSEENEKKGGTNARTAIPSTKIKSAADAAKRFGF